MDSDGKRTQAAAIARAPFELAGRRTLLLADGDFTTFGAKTAVCYLRYRSAECVAVLDASNPHTTVEQAVGFGGDVPIVKSIEEALANKPEVAVVGVAPVGGGLDDALRAQIVACLEAGVDIVSGLHVFLNDDEALVATAETNGARMWDVRPADGPWQVGTGAGCTTGAKTVLVAGTDCNVGKMTATLQLYDAAVAAGVNAAWAATGQTGMMLRGRGVCIDRVVSDFTAGATEALVNEEGAGRDVVFVEGQGSLVHPGYAGVTLGLLFGAMPDCIVLVHSATRTEIGDSGFAMPALVDMVELHEATMAPLKRSPVVAIAVNTAGLDDTTASGMIEQIRRETGLPACDPVRDDAAVPLEAIRKELNL